MTLHTSIVITGDVDGASAAVRQLAGETENLGNTARTAGDNAGRAGEGAKKLGDEAARAAEAAAQAASGALAYQAAVDRLFDSTQGATRSEAAFSQALADVRREGEALGYSVEALNRVQAGAERLMEKSAQTAGALAGEVQEAGRAMGGAVGQATSLATSVGAIDQRTAAAVRGVADFAQAIGALSGNMGRTQGAGGALALFLRGPLAGAVSAAIGVIVTMTGSLLANEDASTRARTAAEGFASIQSELGRMFELSTGKIRENTAAIRANVMMMALRMEQEGIDQRNSALRALGGIDANWGAVAHDVLRTPPGGVTIPRAQMQAARQRAYIQQILRRVQNGTADPAAAALVLSRADTSRLNMTGLEIADAGNQFIQANQNIEAARRAQQSVISGRLDESFRNDSPRVNGLGKDRPGGGGGGGRPRDNSAAVARLAEFGRDAQTRIFELGEQFTDTPAQVQRVARALADLDDLLEDIERRRPPGFEDLLRQGREARGVIEDGINKPFDDFVKSQEDALAIMRLQALGREAEAEALGIIQRLEAQMGPLTEERKNEVLETVQALRAEQRAMEELRESQQKYLDALGQTRDIIQGTIRGVLDGDLRALRDLPGQLRKSFNDLLSRYLTENLFGGAFRELQDHVTGNNIAREAAGRFRDGAVAAEESAYRAARALDQVATAASGQPPPSLGDAGAVDDIVVTQQRVGTPLNPRRFFEDVLTRMAEGILGRQAAQVIGRVVSQGLEGAAYGSMAGGLVGGLLGGRQSQTGAALGGALGNILGEAVGPAVGKAVGGSLGQALGSAAGPIGSIVGGIAGSLLGGLLSGSKRGSASITSVDGPASVSGNSSSFRSAASGMAGNVQDALQTIAEQLGGGVGAFSVSIGVRDGKYRVDPTGQGNTKKKKSVDFGEDQAAAVAFAIADAIADGAITGLSSAVQAALRSSSDVNKALREALKVDELETLLAGPGGEVAKAFKDFERQAAERLRIARKYGFDVVKLEELNAKERLKMFEDIVKSRVGSLQGLLDSLNFGDLFEGSIAEQRQKLLVEVAKAEEAAKAGEEGAADRVADLRRQLLDLTRGGFGTAGGEYAADRASTRSAAEEIIRLENERVKAAQEAQLATNAHLVKGNDLASEANWLLAEQNALLRSLIGLGGGGGGGGGGGDFAAAREVSFL